MKTISARELDRYIGDESCLIVDLRSRGEYLNGHIQGAVNVPQGRFSDELEGTENRWILLYCKRGALSMAAARELEAKGWHTISVVGGIQAYRGKNMTSG